ncbi:MAG: VCBS repeat-containing protein [Alphaproteobacteria bacterium]|nr:VCBS repeat-containing protein [Alphaproteobacteria bacterium]
MSSSSPHDLPRLGGVLPASLLLLLLTGLLPAARAELPLPLQPECGTPDRPDLCPSDLGSDWVLLSYVPAEWQTYVRSEELALGTGVGADRAWRTSTGRTDVVLAVLDSGYLWDDEKLREKIQLNVGELPLPQDPDGVPSETYDYDGNGFVNVDDWVDDPRVDITAGVDVADGILDGSDLIHSLSDGIDDDGNGYVDDIAGWDFLWNDNDPYDDTRYDHGTYEGHEAANQGEDGRGGIGSCPNCFVLPVRVGDSFVADGSNFAMGTLFAVDSGASVIQEALGTLNHPTAAGAAIDYAWEHDVLVIASAADETAWHPNSPGWDDHTFYVHAVVPDEDDKDEATTFLAYSNCTNHGARLDASASASGCSSGATAITSGVAGLVLGAARDRGIELGASELYQLLLATTDDIDVPESQAEGSAYYPSKPGWERHFGEGRINAWRAVEAVVEGRIPPHADLLAPTWFDHVDPSDGLVDIVGEVSAPRGAVASWVLEVADGIDPDAGDWTALASGTGEAEGVLASWDPSTVGFDPSQGLADHVLGDDQVDRSDAVNQWTVTLKLTVTDTMGNTARMRRAVYVQSDPDALDAFPRKVGPSFEASPTLYDLDGDGVLDIVIADADGWVHVLTGQGTEVEGWPVRLGLLEEADPEAAGNHLDSPGLQALGGGLAPSIVATPAVGDLDGDGSPEVVVASLRGQLWVLDATGAVREGFPVAQDAAPPTDPDHLYDEGFFSSPALGDLDGDGTLEIVIGGMDQQVYAWHADGTRVDGWPVCACWPGADAGTRIISSPGLGDVDGDGVLDVAIGTQETLSSTTGPIYVISGRGNADPDGPFLEGWPESVFGAYTQALPYVGEGVPASPALADVDGDGQLELTAHTLAGDLPLFSADSEDVWTAHLTADGFGPGTNLNDAAIFPLINSSSFGDLNGDGVLDLVSGGIGAGYAIAQLQDGKRAPFDHGVGAWDGRTGEYLPGWPRVIEDLQFFMNPAIADLDDDGKPEVISGSAGSVVHAWDMDGEEPAGWPKHVGHWVLSSPAVGDIDGDGMLDVVVATRQGWLFAWTTRSPASATVAWAGFGHDPANTANAHTPLPPQYGGADPADPAAGGVAGKGCGGCKAKDRAETGAAALLLALPGLFVLRRRRRSGRRR